MIELSSLAALEVGHHHLDPVQYYDPEDIDPGLEVAEDIDSELEVGHHHLDPVQYNSPENIDPELYNNCFKLKHDITPEP